MKIMPDSKTDTANRPFVEIYTSPFCGFCMRAKKLLEKKGVAYEEYDVMMKPGLRKEMIERAGDEDSYTVPQIFIDDEHIGGCDDLMFLDFEGELDTKLALA